jgi:mono/diheme cytochrome c family protein
VRLILLLLPILLISQENLKVDDESFLSDIEYGEMLYNNPRGIPCSKCHGKKGKGGHKIAKYYDKYSNPKILKGADITHYSLEELKASLSNRFIDKKNHRKRHKIMPIYYLTDKEIKAIHIYLKSVKKR